MDTIPVIGISIWMIVKVLILIFLAIYVIFALVVLRQVNLMTKTLIIGFEFPIKLLAVLHLAFALAVVAVSLLIL